MRDCCPCGNTIDVRVHIPADLSHHLSARWALKPIDYCIAPIVNALQSVGIDMRGSCCGHGEHPGEILLQDGRVIRIEGADCEDLRLRMEMAHHRLHPERKLVYVAGPYSGPDVLTVLGNMGDGERAARLVFQAGFSPFAPWHDARYYMDMTRPERADLDVEFFKRQSMRFVEAADVVLLLDTWERSSGARAERAYAQELGIPCVVLNEEVLEYGDVDGVRALIEGAAA